jgi:hypothetical protein
LLEVRPGHQVEEGEFHAASRERLLVRAGCWLDG